MISRTRRQFLRMMTLTIVLVGVTSPIAVAHPYHLCVGQMTWNTKSKIWETSIRVHPQDLERSLKAWRMEQLSSEDKSKIEKGNLEPLKGCSIEDDGFEQTVEKYLSTQFFFWNVDSKLTDKELTERLKSDALEKEFISTIHWIGREQEKGWLWLHFELTPAPMKKEQKVWVVNQIFLDSVTKQENSLSLKQGKRETKMQFNKDKRLLVLEME